MALQIFVHHCIITMWERKAKASYENILSSCNRCPNCQTLVYSSEYRTRPLPVLTLASSTRPRIKAAEDREGSVVRPPPAWTEQQPLTLPQPRQPQWWPPPPWRRPRRPCSWCPRPCPASPRCTTWPPPPCPPWRWTPTPCSQTCPHGWVTV